MKENRKYNNKFNLNAITKEVVNKKKMYKSKGAWVVASAFLFFSSVSVINAGANDATPVVMQQAPNSTSSATTPTQPTTSLASTTAMNQGITAQATSAPVANENTTNEASAAPVSATTTKTNQEREVEAQNDVPNNSWTSPADVQANQTVNQAVKDNKATINAAGGKITQVAPIDSTKMDQKTLDSSVKAQVDNISSVADGDTVIKDSVDSVGKDTPVKGDSINMTGKSKSEVLKEATKQAIGLGSTDALRETINKTVATAQDIQKAGGDIKKIKVDDSKRTTTEASAATSRDTMKIEAVNFADRQLVKEIDEARKIMEKHGGKINKESAIDATNISDDDLKASVDKQVQDIKNIASTDEQLDALAELKSATGALAVKITETTDGSKMSAAQQAQYVQEVSTRVHMVLDANQKLKELTDEITANEGSANINSPETVTKQDQIKATSDLEKQIAVQKEKVALRNKTAEGQKTIAGQIQQAKDKGLNPINDGTVVVNSVGDVDNVVKQNQANIDAVKDDIDKVNQAVDSAPKNIDANGGRDGYTASGHWQALNSNNNNANFLGKDIKISVVSPDGKNISNNQVMIASPTLDNAHLITSIVWDNQNPEVVNGKITMDHADPNHYGYKGSTKTLQVAAGTQLKFANAVHLADGSSRDLYVTFDGGGDGYDAGKNIDVYNLNGQINSYVSGVHAGNKVNNTMRFSVGAPLGQNKEDYLFISTITDIDLGQTADTDNNTTVIAVGGGLKSLSGDGNTRYIKADINLGGMNSNGYGINRTLKNALNDADSYPDGTIIAAHYGTSWSVGVINDPTSSSIGVAQGMFGQSGKVNAKLINPDVKLKNVDYNYTPEHMIVTPYNTPVSVLSTNYKPYSAQVEDHYYTYHPMDVEYERYMREPATPKTPEKETPKTPETPSTPATTSTPVQQKEQSPQPGEKQETLPQTGDSENLGAEIAGAVALAIGTLELVGSRKRKISK